ncbi:hypothetical protein NG702_12100 [Pseudarthrobacter sp. MDT3-28]|nr:hypothetical protein [Pseudarthrobacter sp. MDT3-28]MCO4238146.1 hypothetical protein [Pseudarthrobacter sp. MDT3-28]
MAFDGQSEPDVKVRAGAFPDRMYDLFHEAASTGGVTPVPVLSEVVRGVEELADQEAAASVHFDARTAAKKKPVAKPNAGRSLSRQSLPCIRLWKLTNRHHGIGHDLVRKTHTKKGPAAER